MEKWFESFCRSFRHHALMQTSRLVSSGLRVLTGMTGFCLATLVGAAEPVYRLNPGDRLAIQVWHEDKLDTKTTVLPDGTLSFPLTGSLLAAGKTVIEVESELETRLTHYLREPEVSVRLIAARGNTVYVTGEVAHPGAYVMVRPVDILQALSMAGGLTPYARKHRILVLRRETSGSFGRIPFDYGEAEAGEALHTNIVLKGGDTVLVP